MRTFGLIGYPLSHSFSAGYFARKFEKEQIMDARYLLFPLPDLSAFPELLKKENPSGLNVTIPFKEQIMPFCDALDETAREVGAVNTIRIMRKDNRNFLKGFNTDIWGFSSSLEKRLTASHRQALVFGSGGASKAVEWVLRKMNIPYHIVSRSSGQSRISYDEVTDDLARESTLWINTTPLGMYPDVDKAPKMPYHTLGRQHLLFDLIYNPAETVFLRHGRQAGAETINGLEMLELQALKAWEIWNEPVQ